MDRPLTVGELNARIKDTLDRAIPEVWVEGEVSRFLAHRSGHWYFSLIDGQTATVSAVMFKGSNQFLRWTPRDGERVICRGRIDVYSPQGKYNVLVRQMEPSGAGARARALEELKRRLAAEGLFDEDRKRPLPFLPKAVGLATSPTGAALQDILKVLARRFPGIPVYLAPCRVQGEGAAEEVAQAIELLNRHGKAEVLIVGRGGGSIEDLWSFNEEVVVRAVAASEIPVISAVGHEIDITLCDLAADLRAPTPSAAAESAVPEQAGLSMHVDTLEERLAGAMSRATSRGRQRVEQTTRRLRHPQERVRDARRQADQLRARLTRAVSLTLSTRAQRLSRARLPDLSPRIERAQVRVQRLDDLQRRIIVQRLARGREALAQNAASLNAMSPLRVLERGYAIAKIGGRAVVKAKDLKVGATVELRFREGRAEAKIVSVEKD
jgi:exodeoxyribonuclease VII large subunit